MLLSEAETNRNSAHIWRIRDRKNPAAGVERLIPTAGSVKGCHTTGRHFGRLQKAAKMSCEAAESVEDAVLRMARVNSNIYAEMVVKMRKLWFSFWW